MLVLALAAAGCSSGITTPRVFYLNGSSWTATADSFETGLRRAGYQGAFEPLPADSFSPRPAAPAGGVNPSPSVRGLVRRIVTVRRFNPRGQIHLVASSTAAFTVVNALAALPHGIEVDNVLLLDSSLSPACDLAAALEHVRGRLYATCSGGHHALADSSNPADAQHEDTAGVTGLMVPVFATGRARNLYAKVVNLSWQPGYAGFGWDGRSSAGGAAAAAAFVRSVLAPRLLGSEPHPLDVPLLLQFAARATPATQPADNGQGG